MEPDETIECVECGGVAHLLTPPGEDGYAPGDLLTYRCTDCMDRFDLVALDDAATTPVADDDTSADDH